MFHLSFDAGTHLITIVRSGFTPLTEVENFERELDGAITSAQSSGKPFDVVIDASTAEVLPQQVEGAVMRMSRMLEGSRVRKVAVVTTSALTGLQRQRLVGKALGSQTFGDMPSALAWIEGEPQ